MTNFSLEVLNPLVLLCGCLLYYQPHKTRKHHVLTRRDGLVQMDKISPSVWLKDA